MFVRRTVAPLARALLLWVGCAGALVPLGRLTLPGLERVVRGGADDFEQLLVVMCGAVALLSSATVLLTVTAVLGELATGRTVRRDGTVRRLVLAACGVAVLATAAPAAARPQAPHRPSAVIAGLPLPDRTTDGPPAARRHDVVDLVTRARPGDSLWTIAAHRLGPGASDADISTYWQRIYARNAAVLGPDPDLLPTGQVLHLPPIDRG